MESVDRAVLAGAIDHTLLNPEAAGAEIVHLCAEANAFGVAAVCVSPTWVSLACANTSLPVASVVGFPSGNHRVSVKVKEAVLAVSDGAQEIDMVANLGLIAGGEWKQLEEEVREVQGAIGEQILLKVILETALWNEQQIFHACNAAVLGGANYVKTSTGFHKLGGASVEAVRLMRNAVGSSIGVKASGGIRNTDSAIAMIEAGATRIGASATKEILKGLV